MSDFDTDFNLTYHTAKQDSTTDLVSTITGGATATIVDAGLSLWNSLPGTDEIETKDVLGRISNNALQVFNENQDTIETASFIAGSFVPAGLAFKGLNLLRNGSKAVNWFTAAGKADDTARVAKLFADAGKGTSEYRKAVRSLYTKTAVNQAIDAAAAEFAVLGMLNESPLVEDYMKDPVQNFGISVALGGVLGAGIGVAADHFAVRSLTGKMEEAALTSIRDHIGKSVPDATNAVALQVAAKNVSFLDEIVAQGKAAGKTAENDLTVSLASKEREIYQREVNVLFDKVVDPTLLKNLDDAGITQLKSLLTEKTDLIGVEKVSAIRAADAVSEKVIKGSAKSLLEETPVIGRVTSAVGPVKPIREAVYFPEHGLYGTADDIKHYAGASALGSSEKELVSSLGKTFGKVAEPDTLLELQVKSAPQIQGSYIAKILKVDGFSKREFEEFKIAATDNAGLQAAIAKMAVEPEYASLGVKIQGETLFGSERYTLSEAVAQVRANTVKEIDSLVVTGVPVESIAIKTNTPKEVVQEYLLTKNLDSAIVSYEARTGKSGLNAIQTVEDARAALAPSKAPLLLTGNPRKNSYAEAFANNNNKMMRDMNSEITAATLYKSTNSFVHQLADLIYVPTAEGGNRGMLDMLYERLGRANNQLSGNFFFQDASFAMRNMEDLGPVVSYLGKGIQKISNEAIKAVNTPITAAMVKVSQNAAEVVEFNTFKEINAGLKGWRTVKEGKIWQRKVDDKGRILYDDAGNAVLEPVMFQGKEYQIVSPNVLASIDEMQKQASKLLDLTNTARRIQGMPDVQDIGLWVPSFNPVNKFIAYVHDSATDKTSIIWANTKEEYNTLVRNYRTSLATSGKDKTIQVYEKGVEQENWSKLNGRLDVMRMEVADSSMLKKGSSGLAVVRSDTQVFTEIEQGYEHYINSQMRNLADLAMHDITHELNTMSALNKYGFESQPLTGVKKIVQRPKDAAANVRNLLLGESNLGEYTGWKDMNQSFETALSFASNTVSKTWDSLTAPLRKNFIGGKKELTTESMQKMDYEKFSKELEAKGIVNPWANFDAEAAKMFGFSKLQDVPDTSKRIVYASNALAATMALKVGELAQPLVNIMSLPILTSLAGANKMPAHFMGASKGTAKVNAAQVIMEGARAVNDPTFAALGKRWEELGYFTPMVSEANDTLKLSRSFDKGAVQNIEKALDSKFVQIMSKPADWSESFVRRQTMYTGAALAKRLYPELDDVGVTIFARDFMDKAVGNFHASQRPVFFQGTLGVALGLFQTYSLTLGQAIYRQLELKNYKALGTAALLQSTLFGAGSMPGFNAVSQLIGDKFSDSNVDLTTGTYRALGDDVAEMVLYGLPSMAGIGTHTRGDANFRIPGLTGDNVVALNFAQQAATAVSSVARSFGEGSNAGQAFLEALSLQSMNRPLARGAELASGYSITRAGNTVQTPEEVWTTTGIAARILGTRPIAETKLREADHLNRYYGAIDKENRQEVIKGIRTAIRNENFQEADLAILAEEYFRNNGTPSGWRSAVNTAIAKTEVSGKEIFVDKLKPNNPLNYMIDKLDGD